MTVKLTTNLISREFETAIDDKSTGFGVRVYPEHGIVICANGNKGGDYVGESGGVVIYALSDGAVIRRFHSPNEVDPSIEDLFATTRDAVLTGTPGVDGVVTCCSRKGSFASPLTSASLIFNLDVSNANPALWDFKAPWSASHDFEDRQNGIDTGGSGLSVPLFSALSPDSENRTVGVSCQRNGIRLYDVDDLSNSGQPSGDGYLFWNNNQAADGPLNKSQETQGLFYNGGYFYVSETTKAVLRIVNAASLVDVGSVDRFQHPDPTVTGVNAWAPVTDGAGKYVFTTYNTHTDPGDKSVCGVIVIDVSNPAAPFVTPNGLLTIPEDDRPIFQPSFDDPESGSRDPACLRITRLKNRIYVSALLSGVAVWNVTNPLEPVYEGILNTELFTMPGSAWHDTVASVAVVDDDGVHSLHYMDGYQPENSGSKSYYRQTILFNGGDTLTTIGTEGLGPETGVYNWVLNGAKYRTAEGSAAVEGQDGVNCLVNFVDGQDSELYLNTLAFRAELLAGGPVDLKLYLVPGSKVVAGNDRYQPGDSLDNIGIGPFPFQIAVADGDGPHLVPAGVVVPALPAGEAYVPVIGVDAAFGGVTLRITRTNTLTGAPSQRGWSADGSADATWATGQVGLHVWAEMTAIPVAGYPQLTAPYDLEVTALGDSVNIASKFSGATSYSAQGLPDGCSINPTTGAITGTIKSLIASPPTVIAKNELTLGVTAAVPWAVQDPGRSSVAVSGGAVTFDAVTIAADSPVYLSPFGLLTATLNNGNIGIVDGSGSDLIINGTTITSPAVLYLSPAGVLTDQPNGDPVANFN